MFKNIHIRDIPPFCVIIGANGTGKSTLFDIFGFLRDALKNNIRQALQFGAVIEKLSLEVKNRKILKSRCNFG
ncbi:MAG UNVERIFIED_CONTAM: AAA family ATPase [Microcystis novacekii LVE1205-3]